MRRICLLLALLFALENSAFATWSVIAVDRSTRRVVMAAASCVNTDDEAMKTAIAVVVPGIGIAACQAAADGTHQNQMLVFQELQKGTDPKAIIEMLSADPQFQSRQFGILDMQGRAAGHSGLGNGFVTQFISGQVPGTEIFYAIQGNTLRALGLTSPKRYELAPDIPTIAEQGLPGYATSSTTLLLAPANTPKEIVDKISAAFQQARESPDVKQKLNAIGQAVSIETPAESIAALRAEAQQWRRLIAERDIKFSQ